MNSNADGYQNGDSGQGKKCVVLSGTQEKKIVPKNSEDFDTDLPDSFEVAIFYSNINSFNHSSHAVETPCSAFSFDKNRALVEKTLIHELIQQPEQTSLKARFLPKAHQLPLAGTVVAERCNPCFAKTIIGHRWAQTPTPLFRTAIFAHAWVLIYK